MTLIEAIRERIISNRSCVFLPEDFFDLGHASEVEQALANLTDLLAPIGEGLLARIRINTITHQPMLDSPGGFELVAKEALDRLQIEWQPSTAERLYQCGGSQLQVNAVVKVQGDRRPAIAYKHYRLIIE